MLTHSRSCSAKFYLAPHIPRAGLMAGLFLALALLVACGGSPAPTTKATNPPRPTVSPLTITEFLISTPTAGPEGIIPGQDGTLWFTESTGLKIGYLTPSGA